MGGVDKEVTSDETSRCFPGMALKIESLAGDTAKSQASTSPGSPPATALATLTARETRTAAFSILGRAAREGVDNC
jgi:hypothetical protein